MTVPHLSTSCGSRQVSLHSPSSESHREGTADSGTTCARWEGRGHLYPLGGEGTPVPAGRGGDTSPGRGPAVSAHPCRLRSPQWPAEAPGCAPTGPWGRSGAGKGSEDPGSAADTAWGPGRATDPAESRFPVAVTGLVSLPPCTRPSPLPEAAGVSVSSPGPRGVKGGAQVAPVLQPTSHDSKPFTRSFSSFLNPF